MASAPVTGAQPCYCLQVVRCGSQVHGITVFNCLFCLLRRHPDSVQRLRLRQCQCRCQSDIAPKKSKVESRIKVQFDLRSKLNHVCATRP